MENLTDKYRDKISGVLGCYDRVILTGTIKNISYAQGMSSYLYNQKINIFDYPKFAELLRDQIRQNAEELSKSHDCPIDFIRSHKERKEDIVKRKLQSKGSRPGLVAILSAMETCSAYRPWHDKPSGKTYLRGSTSKCLHYYFYVNDKHLGLCYFRVPTWCPFRLQIYINGHNILKDMMDTEGLTYTMLDNSFDSISDWERAQELSNTISIEKIHEKLDAYANLFCPVVKEFSQKYHFSIMQAEYATDIVFKNQSDLQEIYENLVMTAIHTVKPDNIATFLGQKLDPRYKGEIGNNYNVRIEGSRIKHSMGKNSIKMYDKFSKILRIETTTNDVTFFKHYREVVHRDGSSTNELANLKKNIYSLPLLQKSLKASNKRYIEFLSAIDDNSKGQGRLDSISQPKIVENRKYRGFNLFDKNDLLLLMTVLRGEFNISGFRNKDLRKYLPGVSSGKISRLLKRLRHHGLIKKIGKTYKYYTTKLAKETVFMGEKIKEFVCIPKLNY